MFYAERSFVYCDALSVTTACWCRYGQVFPYDDEIAVTRRRRKKSKPGKKVQTQTSPQASPSHPRSQPPTSMLITEHPAPTVFVTEPSPGTTPRDPSPVLVPVSLPGAIEEEQPWARPYPEPTTSVTGPQTQTIRKKTLTVRRQYRTISPSAVDVTGSQLRDSSSPRAGNSGPQQDLFTTMPDVHDGSSNVKPG